MICSTNEGWMDAEAVTVAKPQYKRLSTQVAC